MCSRAKDPVLPPVESLNPIAALQKFYEAKVYPVERRCLYADFYTP